MTSPPPRYARPLLGRGVLLERVRALLEVRNQIVSLVGPGGVGKTRLAAAAATGVRCLFVALGSVTQVDEIPGLMATALGLGSTDEAEVAVAAALGDRVVVLDEVEHLQGLEPLLGRWLAACPGVSWLVTSRRALSMDAEVVVDVPPLELPDAGALDGSAAAGLLRNAAPVELDLHADPEAVAAVLRLTGGLPLAIELAAARLALLPIEQLRKRIDGRYFATLRDPVRPGRGLEVILEDSWEQLTPAVQQSLAEASVFAAAFAVEDAEVVLGAGAGVLDHLHTLRSLHLLRSEAGRLWLLEPVRRFAAARLSQEATRQACERHAVWFGQRSVTCVDELSHDAGRVDELAGIAAELRVVLTRAEAGEVPRELGYRCVYGLLHLTLLRGSSDTVLSMGERGLRLGMPPGETGRASRARVLALYVQRLAAEGRPGALESARAALDGAEGLPAKVQSNLYLQLGGALHISGDLSGARRAFERAIELGAGIATWPWAVAELALVTHDEGRSDEAQRLLDDARRVAVERGDRRAEARVVEVGATIAVEMRDLAEGARWNGAFRTLSEEFGDQRKVGLSQLYDGVLAEAGGELDVARAAFVAARERLDEADAHRLVAKADGLLGRIALATGELEDAARLLPAWGDTWTRTGTEAQLYGAVLAGLRGDVAAASEGADVAGSPLAQLAARVAPVLAAPLEQVPGAGELQELRAAVETLSDPIERRLGECLLQRASARAAGWVLAADGTWARTPSGERVELGRSRANAAMLAALADARVGGGGALDVAALSARVWPGEQLLEKSARTRVYVALSGLRKAGLEALIVRGAEGWFLDPDQPVFVECD